MTVDHFELNTQLGKACSYVKQGIQILCRDDLNKYQKLTCVEESLSCWQQRYFYLQEENKRLHNVLVSKDDFLEQAMHNYSVSKDLHDRLQGQDAEIKKIKQENIMLRNNVTELQSDETFSDLLSNASHNTKTISDLESELLKWRILVTDIQRRLISSEDNLADTSLAFSKLLQSIETRDPNSKPLKDSTCFASLQSITELTHQLQHIRDETIDVRKTCEILCSENAALQTECQTKSETILKLQSSQERLEDPLHMHNFQKIANDLAVAKTLLYDLKIKHDSLKSSNEELKNELEIQRYRNDALDEVSRELASKVQSGIVVDVTKYKQLEQDKAELQALLSEAGQTQNMTLKKLAESDARLQKMEGKCQTLQESLDKDDQIRLKYRELFKELEESLSSNKRLKEANEQLDDRVKKLNSDLNTATNECDNVNRTLQEIIENQRCYKERADAEANDSAQKIDNLKLSLEKKSLSETDLRAQLQEEAGRSANLKALSESLQVELMSVKSGLNSVQSNYEDLKARFDMLLVEKHGLVSQNESLEVAKDTALDMVSSTKSQLMEAESRENALNNTIESLQSAVTKLTDQAEVSSQERRELESDICLKNGRCEMLEKELEESSEGIKTLRHQIDMLKENVTNTNLQHVEDAERIETIQTENKSLKIRLDKLEDMNKMLQQDIPTPQSEDLVISRERGKTKALSKQVTILKKKFKELEKDCQRWKALYEKEIVGKSLM